MFISLTMQQLFQAVIFQHLTLTIFLPMSYNPPKPLSPPSPRLPAPLLSNLQITLPRPQPKKPSTSLEPSQYDLLDYYKNSKDSQYFLMSGSGGSGRTKNSSSTGKSQSQIITEWVRSMFVKKGLLGVSWQQKLQNKRKVLMRQCFTALKQYEPCHSSTLSPFGLLQTQSKYNHSLVNSIHYVEYKKKINKLVVLGMQKMVEIWEKIVSKRRRDGFGKIREMREYNGGSLNYSRSSQDRNSRMDREDGRIRYKNSNKEYVSPYQPHKHNKQQQTHHNNHKSLKRHAQIVPNQYSLSPFITPPTPLSPSPSSPTPKSKHHIFTQQLLQSPRIIPSSHQNHPMFKSYNGVEQHLKTKNISGKQQNVTMKYSQQCLNMRFSLPYQLNHQHVNAIRSNQGTPQIQFIPAYTPHNNNNDHSARPHSHQPFNFQPTQRNDNSRESHQQRTRTTSAHHKIKISFHQPQQVQQQQPQPHTVYPWDYQSQPMPQQPISPRLSHQFQPRQTRQSYKQNIMTNELLPQDHPSPHLYSPKIQHCSSPITPKTIHSPVVNRNAEMGNSPRISYRNKNQKGEMNSNNDYYVHGQQKRTNKVSKRH